MTQLFDEEVAGARRDSAFYAQARATPRTADTKHRIRPEPPTLHVEARAGTLAENPARLSSFIATSQLFLPIYTCMYTYTYTHTHIYLYRYAYVSLYMGVGVGVPFQTPTMPVLHKAQNLKKCPTNTAASTVWSSCTLPGSWDLGTACNWAWKSACSWIRPVLETISGGIYLTSCG